MFQEENKEDSIGSAGSLAHRSEKSRGGMNDMWEEEDELSGAVSFRKTLSLRLIRDCQSYSRLVKPDNINFSLDIV